jgi:hypothetical protein
LYFHLKTQQQTHRQRQAQISLFTGKAIKNIHILVVRTDDRRSTCLAMSLRYADEREYKMLQFRYNGAGALLGVSKSDGTKVACDLSHDNNESDNDDKRQQTINRPPFQDVTILNPPWAWPVVLSQLVVVVANQMSIVSL